MALRAFGLACSIPWAITPEALQQILEISTREHIPNFEAVAAKRARRMDSADEARVREGGVAVLSITGPIFRYADFFTDISGGSTIEGLAKDFNALLADPTVTSILLNIDSPGGEVGGVSEFAQMVFGARGRKPIVAYVDGLGASAAYWIASAADEIVADRTAMIGSIGVVATVPNPDARTAKEVQFVSSQSPKKRPNPNTESGKEQLQTLVDDLAEVFVETVARNRDVDADTVLSDFGRGSVMVGQRAVEAGLADRLGSFEQIVSELATGKKPRRFKPKMAASAAEVEEMKANEILDKIKSVISKSDTEASEAKETPATEPTAKAGLDELTAKAGEESARAAAAEAENERLRKQVAEQRQQKVEADAQAFVIAQIAANRILPAEAEATKADYLQAAADDAAMPMAAGSRVDNLRKRVESRPSHKLTQELTVGATDKVLKADENKQTEMSAERRSELLNMTSAGKAALSVVK
jgi:signal peptide peptidase SppA